LIGLHQAIGKHVSNPRPLNVTSDNIDDA
jgi:hypothetical protein